MFQGSCGMLHAGIRHVLGQFGDAACQVRFYRLGFSIRIGIDSPKILGICIGWYQTSGISWNFGIITFLPRTCLVYKKLKKLSHYLPLIRDVPIPKFQPIHETCPKIPVPISEVWCRIILIQIPEILGESIPVIIISGREEARNNSPNSNVV